MAGFQLARVQRGLKPDNWKPLKTIGAGVEEVRVRETSGAYRVIYIARLKKAVYVLHAFHKKAQRPSKRDLELARQRLKSIDDE